MMFRSLVSAVAVFVVCVAQGLCQTHFSTYCMDVGDQPDALLTLDDQTSVMASLTNFDLRILTSLMRTDRTGEVLWYRLYDVDQGDFAVFHDLVQDGDGNLIAVGTVDSSPLLARVRASDGEWMWGQTLEGFGRLTAVARGTDGRLTAVGTVEDNVWIVDFDENGQILGTFMFGADGSAETGLDIVASDHASMVVAARTNRDQPTGSRPMIFKLDSQRRVEWTTRLGDGTNTQGSKLSLDTSPQGDIVVASGDNFGGAFDGKFWIFRLSEDGNLQWSYLYEQSIATCRDIHGTEDGGCLVLGDFNQPTFIRSIWLMKLDESGTLEWEHNLGNPNTESFGFALDLSAYGGILCAGTVPHATRVGHVSPRLHRLEPDGAILTSCSDYATPDSVRTPVSVEVVHQDPPRTSRDDNSSPLSVIVSDLAVDRTSTCESCYSNVVNYGQGTPGSGGITPTMEGERGSCTGSPPRMTAVRNALGSSFGILIFGLNDAEIPFLGGDLYVDPNGWKTLPFQLRGSPGQPGAGFFEIPGDGDVTQFLGLAVYMQAVILDPGTSDGYAFTGGLRTVIGN